MAYSLRPYQTAAISAVSAGWSEWQRQLIVLPTGAGKTIVFSSIVAEEPGRSLVMTPGEPERIQNEEMIFPWGEASSSPDGLSIKTPHFRRSEHEDRIDVGLVKSLQEE